ncbi:hypothetical protein JKP88DRAFT_219613 [Tribonema minus]|uniref:Uncharacterized protein n=1 Tax=Tribonema minus TaxID=303371 RepID=A0A835YZQ6_9STRA|nr:hypothetical protein JKP88DRAFT_219613 [Tribonema minus]
MGLAQQILMIAIGGALWSSFMRSSFMMIVVAAIIAEAFATAKKTEDAKVAKAEAAAKAAAKVAEAEAAAQAVVVAVVGVCVVASGSLMLFGFLGAKIAAVKIAAATAAKITAAPGAKIAAAAAAKAKIATAAAAKGKIVAVKPAAATQTATDGGCTSFWSSFKHLMNLHHITGVHGNVKSGEVGLNFA